MAETKESDASAIAGGKAMPVACLPFATRLKEQGHCVVPCTEAKTRKEIYDWAEEHKHGHMGCVVSGLAASQPHLRYYCAGCCKWQSEAATAHSSCCDSCGDYSVTCDSCDGVLWHQDAHERKGEYKRKMWSAHNAVILFNDQPSVKDKLDVLRKLGVKVNKRNKNVRKRAAHKLIAAAAALVVQQEPSTAALVSRQEPSTTAAVAEQ